MSCRYKALVGAAVVAGFGTFSSAASAELIGTFNGNDCAGAFGANFNECRIPANIDPNQSPIIIKFEFSGGGTLSGTEINSALFPSIDGSEFSFDFATRTWTYTPGADDPLINYFVAKGGNQFNLFGNLGDPNSDVWSTPLGPQGQPLGLSHLSFYDTNRDEVPGPKVPEPATMLLLGAGLLAIGVVRRRRRD